MQITPNGSKNDPGIASEGPGVVVSLESLTPEPCYQLEEEGEALRDQLRGGKGRSRMDERHEEMREVPQPLSLNPKWS
jgi:hypothetical protein